jgi:cytochrome c biogenesis protein
MQALGILVDKAWDALASVKLTIFILVALLLLAIPGTVVLQYNISNVDPGVQYSYDFWSLGDSIQLFTSYHSFWYTGLIALMSINLIACSVNRWPQMLRLAVAKPVLWARETFLLQPSDTLHDWKTPLSAEEAKTRLIESVRRPTWLRPFGWGKPVLLEDAPGRFQLFWQTGRWTRIANYLVHTSLLVIFTGAIVSALYGFEGAVNLPTGQAVDTFIVFKEGKFSGLQSVDGGLINERLLGFRLRAEDFRVKFYPDFPGRPSDFISRLSIERQGQKFMEKTIVVNDPMEFEGMAIYQSSYGPMNDYRLQLRVIDKARPIEGQSFVKTKLGEVQDLPSHKARFVAVQALMDVQGFGPGVQFQILEGETPRGKPFWVLKDHQNFDFRNRSEPWGIVIDELDELYFTGLQVGYDPGAPIYWLGCLGMLLGTFYALFITHKKYYAQYENGRLTFTATIHRLPFGFEKAVARHAARLKSATQGAS